MDTARQLADDLARLLRHEHGAMADFLLALARFDERQRWRELGHTSLFYFLHRELKLSKGAAQNRKTAAELIQAFPEVESALRSGELCLSTVNELAKVLTPENRAEVLPRFFGLSRRDAEAVAAALRPAAVVPEREVVTVIRATGPAPRALALVAAPSPASAPPGHSVHPDEPPRSVIHPGEPPSLVTTGGSSTLPAAPPPPRETVKPLDAEVARLHLTVSRAFLDKLEAATDALGHACPVGNAAEILERGLDLVLAQRARRHGLVEKPRRSRGPSRADLVPAEVKREVWRRAGGRCEWTLESGERCGCRRRLEYDHVQPLALGGASTIDNVRLVCRPHNVLAARHVFGDALMDRYTAPTGPCSAAPRRSRRS
ncbi:HNH endonuclease [Anaeromyxobacter dehalogenans 2CP-1]|uniref:HNH endonuclease n=1 Tax=Anaeromyxobacter dehalogenans (strain ATCC BAA-258 / DSM 21875 / 2CP-1) TaxID=455488 RepID=B8JAT0_ANAD2|nr:HNH endonuclease signature motif containing protein [Anaeromyxobacter dehalogenans]ACL67579.1 HNH endonuclease [Anaeromyxobacter dehalogenans 2CP-1]